MRKLLSPLRAFCKYIRTDGLLHICVTALLLLFFGWLKPLWLPNLIVFCIGLLKEIWDAVTGRGTAEWHDVICDVLGLVVGNLYLLMYSWIL